MSRKTNKRRLRRRNMKAEQSSTSNSGNSPENLMQSIARAQSAVEAGQIAEATDILTDELVDAICEMFEKDTPRTDILLALAILFRKIGQLDRARQWYDKVLRHGPDAEAYNELGCLFYDQGRIAKAAQYHRKALETEPNRPDFCANFARATMSSGKMQEGISLLRKVVEKMPENPQVHSNYLFRLHQLTNIDQQMLFEEHKRWAQIHAPISRAKTNHDNEPNMDRRLRIGYISPDFRSHSVAYFFESLLDGHDRRAVEVYGYGNVALPDHLTERLKEKFDHYRDIRGADYQEVARLIEQDKIDILVDLAGHVGEIGLPVLSYKPAPVQVSYLGYPDTTGMQQVDYRLTDALADLPRSQEFYTEELVYLPDGFLCYRPSEFAPAVVPLPAEEKGYVTFGSFNNASKINPVIIELWARILNAKKDSRLLLKIKGGDEKETRDYYLNQFEQNRVSPERIDILGWLPRVEQLRIYGQVDIALDTYPYNGTTTTCEALWMGVPVISLVGEHHISRVGLSILSRVQMESFAAGTPQEYVAKAAALAARPETIAKIRLTMRARIAASGLCCAKNFARDVENAYRKMWRRWCESRRDDIPTKNLQPVGNTERHSVSGHRPENDRPLKFDISNGGSTQFVASKGNMPEFLIRANTAVENGRIDEAIDILSDEAVENVRQILKKDPTRLDVMFVLAVLFDKTQQLCKAEEWYKRILQQEPNALVCYQLGLICRQTERLWEAIEYTRKAVQADPENAEFLWNLGSSLMAAGEIQEGANVLRQVVEMKPANVKFHSAWLRSFHYLPNITNRILCDEHTQWAEVHTPLSQAKTTHDNCPDPDRRLRVGYISPDFREHSVAYFFESLLDGHDRLSIEVCGYANVASPDEVTDRLKNKFDQYRNIAGVDAKEVSDLIEQDRIDILVDLAGHTSNNSLAVLAYKPAPVQITYLGYPDTTGMEQIDYRLTDALADSPQSQEFYTEKLVFLPDGFLCYRPPESAPPAGPLPAQDNGYITFGSFNNNCKINPYITELWAQILKATENSRLLLKFKQGNDNGVRNHYLRQFEQLGISPDRVEICGWKSRTDHLLLYNQVDIALDTYPYNGTTTTCEALWMGVPVISLIGGHHASRVGLSILSRVGMEFFAAKTPQEYVAKAVALAVKPDALAKMRATMRARIVASGLCNAKAFAGNVEAAYRKMWRQWCQSQPANTVSEICKAKI